MAGNNSWSDQAERSDSNPLDSHTDTDSHPADLTFSFGAANDQGDETTLFADDPLDSGRGHGHDDDLLDW